MWKSRKGSVSVTLVLLIAPLFTFHATLIDAVRVKMGERQAETATKAALRSVLSAYDPVLQGYGLFGVGDSPEASAELFTRVFQENLSAGGNVGFKLIEPISVSESLKPLYTLGNQAVFGRQVLEEMKYRAPVEFALSVTDKLTKRSGTASMLGGMSNFADKAKTIEQLMSQRDDFLDDAWTDAQRLAEKTSIFRSYYAKKLERLNELCQLIGLRDAEELRRSVQSLRAQADSLRRAIAEKQAGLAGMMQAGVQAVEQIAAIQQSIMQLEQSWNELNKQIGELEKILQYIAEYTLLMNTTKMEAGRDQIAMTEMVQSIMDKLDRAKEIDDRIRAEINTLPPEANVSQDTLNAAAMPDSYYIKYKTGIGGIGALYSGFETSLAATTLFAGDNKFDSARMQALTGSNDAYGQRAVQFTGEQRVEEQKRAAGKENVSRRKKEERKRFGEIWDQARKIWAECGNGSSEAYKRLEAGDPASGTVSLYRKYADYNRVAVSMDVSVNEMGDADEALKNTTGMIGKLLDGLASAAGQFRDELYINEYALTKFNYRTYGKETGPDGKLKPDYEKSERGSHELQAQEAEYLLYGLNSCLKNQSAAYSEMFAIRLAVRTAEALLSPEAKAASMGNPMVMLLWSLAEGAVKAFADMTKLVNGEEVPVTAKAPATLTMNYKDYLRLFLLLHTKREPMTARMQSLINLNTGRDLRETAVYLQARTETNIRLWFMPYTLAAFGYPIQGNQASVSKTASLSY
ncbi:hypothetical protein FE783_11945 [Paenibacillus mesophilus]|uniref:hypothetical protein n=1 Tax=Paenibacillus mesophilus TaxID=2582849 RepID=UPI00110E6A07|nr:hypothetical protein [Paenibacillus mesophilus]TMV50258.1 hypothetical protein FE783_11945 [Paenibacillus mesophilus]